MRLLRPGRQGAVTAFSDAQDAVLADLVERDAVGRLFAADHTLWRDDPTELADRLGWIPVVRRGARRTSRR